MEENLIYAALTQVPPMTALSPIDQLKRLKLASKTGSEYLCRLSKKYDKGAKLIGRPPCHRAQAYLV